MAVKKPKKTQAGKTTGKTIGKKATKSKNTHLGLQGVKKITTRIANLQTHSNDARKLATRGTKYDWEEARVLFLTETPAVNLKQVSQRTGIPYVQVRQKAARERWNVLRAQEQASVMKSKRQEHLRRLAGESMKFDDDSIDTSRIGMGIVTSRLIEISRIYAAQQQANGGADYVIAKINNGEPISREDLYSVINYKEIRELSQAAQIFQEIGRRAFGSDTTDAHLFEEDGTDIEKVVSIGVELGKDDPQRLAGFVEALERAGMLNLNIGPEDADEDDTEAVRVIEGGLVLPDEGQKAIEGVKDEGSSVS